MDKRANVFLVVATVGCLAVAAFQNCSLSETRSNRVGDLTGIANPAPIVTFVTVVLGGFRGLIADVLWLRATHLQDEARFFELAQLAEWITQLEPSCTQIWAYHAWNMSYNVSVMMSDDEDRWRWVNNGVRLLRDKGIPANPEDPQIYCELGWLYQHKIGKDMDPAHMAFKMKLAESVQALLNGEGPDYAALEVNSELARDLARDFSLDLRVMQRIDRTYGPLDWRLPETHAIYWAYLGKRRANGEKQLPANRIIYQGMAYSFFLGDLISQEGGLSRAPRWPLLPKVHTTFKDALAAHDDDENITEAYVGFLRNAVLVLHAYGKEDESKATFDTLHELAPSTETQAGLELFVGNKNIRMASPGYVREILTSLPGKVSP